MAHHLAEILEEVRTTEGKDHEMACEQATDLILKIWSHKKSLPHGAYPLNPRLFMGHVDKGFQPGVFVRSESGFS